MGRVQQFVAEMQNRTLFFSLWWKDLDDRNAERLMSSAGDYRYYLEEIRHFKPHTLSEAGREDRQPQGCDRRERADHPCMMPSRTAMSSS